jgi:hypothetical protein
MASTLTVTPPRQFELDEYSTHSYTLFILRFILILFNHLLRSLPSGLCLSGFPTIIVFTFLVFSMRVTCFAYLILDFIAVIMSDVEYSLLVEVETVCCNPFSSFIIYHYDLGLPECTVAVLHNWHQYKMEVPGYFKQLRIDFYLQDTGILSRCFWVFLWLYSVHPDE